MVRGAEHLSQPDADADGAGSTGSPPRRAPRGRLTRRQRQRLVRWSVYGVTVAAVVAAVALADWAKLRQVFLDPDIFRGLFPELITVAAKNTLILAVLAFAGGLLFGLGLALMRLSSIRPYRWAALAYIELFRGIPAILTLILVAYVLPIGLQVRVGDLLPFLGEYATPAVGLAIVAAAYMAETIRGGIEAVPKGQMEAARSLGMGYGRAMASIVVPQAFRVMIPPLTNEFVLLIKDTSLIFVIGVTASSQDITFFTRSEVQDTLNGTPFVAAALMYLIITLPLTALSRRLERRGGPSVRKAARLERKRDVAWDG